MKRRARGRAVAAVAAAVAAAVGCRGGSEPSVVRALVVEQPQVVDRELDLLFVIDDTISLDRQGELAQDLGALLDQLATIDGELPDLHAGVITTDMGTSASGSATPAPDVGGCAGFGKAGDLQTVEDVNGAFLIDERNPDGTRQRNYTGELVDVLGRMVEVGAGGCGFEQPLAALRAALDDNPDNATFLRDDALLAVILLDDEDDCSIHDPALFGPDDPVLGPRQSFRCTRFGVTCAIGGETPSDMALLGLKDLCSASEDGARLDRVEDFHDFVRQLRPDPRKLVVASIHGDVRPFEISEVDVDGAAQPALAHACAYETIGGERQFADPAVRLQAFVESFGERGVATRVCDDHLDDGLLQIARRITRGLGTPCVSDPLLDTDPAAPGIQPDCEVEDAAGATTTPISPCGPSPTAPCFRVVADPDRCAAAPDALRLDVVRDAPPPADTITRMRCALR